MMKFQNKKSKSTQYVIGGTVAVVILALWIAFPLMSGSSLDSNVSTGNPFRSKVADIGMLGSDISSEAGAPGSPLSGEMINNPATSGEEMASSLFQSGPSEEEAPAAATADASAAAPAVSGPSGSASAPAPVGPRGGKLAAAASITGGNSNSMTAGGNFNKFFGSGNQKSEFAPAAPTDFKKLSAAEKKSGLVAMLSSSAKQSDLAAKTGKMDEAKGGASAAFGSSAKGPGLNDLNTDTEKSSALTGLQMGQAAQDLKKNDPALSKTKVTPPSKPKDATDESEEMKKQIKMMVIQMVLKMALGAVFGVAA